MSDWEANVLENAGFESGSPWTLPTAEDVWPTPVKKGEWQEFGFSQTFYYRTWRDKWRALWSILHRGRVQFKLSLQLRTEGEGVTYLDAPDIRQVNEGTS